MTFGAHDPNGQHWLFQVLSNLEVTKVLKEGQKSYFRLTMDALKHKIVAHLLIAVMHVAGTSTHKHCVNQLLRSIAVLVD